MCRIYTRRESERLEKKLSRFLQAEKLSLSNDLDIISLCKKLGIQANYVDLSETDFDGCILVNKNYKFIGISDDLEPIDVRFLIAHELAHYIDNAVDKKPHEVFIAAKDKFAHGEDKLPIEHDMDYLAAAILVPQQQFIEDLDALNIDYKKLVLHTEREVRDTVSPDFVTYLSKRYRVREQLIVRRIAEVSYYV